MKILLHKGIHTALARAGLLCRQRKRIFIHHEQIAQIILPQILVEAIFRRKFQQFPHGAISALSVFRSQGLPPFPLPLQRSERREHSLLRRLAVHQ